MTQLPAALKVTTPPEIEQLALVVESIVIVTGEPRARRRGGRVGRTTHRRVGRGGGGEGDRLGPRAEAP